MNDRRLSAQTLVIGLKVDDQAANRFAMQVATRGCDSEGMVGGSVHGLSPSKVAKLVLLLL